MGANSRLGAYSNKYGMHRGGEGMGKLVGGGGYGLCKLLDLIG